MKLTKTGFREEGKTDNHTVYAVQRTTFTHKLALWNEVKWEMEDGIKWKIINSLSLSLSDLKILIIYLMENQMLFTFSPMGPLVHAAGSLSLNNGLLWWYTEVLKSNLGKNTLATSKINTQKHKELCLGFFILFRFFKYFIWYFLNHCNSIFIIVIYCLFSFAFKI